MWLECCLILQYDKLKPYGFPVHGCICGYSRKIIWLEVNRSNNNPKIPARFYLNAIQNVGGCPMIMWSDCGSENVLVVAMQSYFWADGADEFAGSKAHQYGSSPSNQRIEGWWYSFRQCRTDWWINYFFKNICESRIIELWNDFQMECPWFCFARVIKKRTWQCKRSLEQSWYSPWAAWHPVLPVRKH